MKQIQIPVLCVGLILGLTLGGLCAESRGADFDNGSTGALGDVIIDQDTTLNLPADGMLHYGSFRVLAGKTLRFTRNPLNTPVYILAKGDVTIEGTIDVSGSPGPNDAPTGGLAGPGGFDGGKPGFADFPPGAGYGPGAGHGGAGDGNSSTGAGSGSYAVVSTAFNNSNKGQTYGSAFLIPLVGGSGGGGTVGSPGRGGGGGGGAILISSNTRIRHTGRILAIGGGPNGGAGNGGSGGAIRLVSPIVSGTGEVNVLGVNNWAGYGRARIDTIDRSDLRLNFQPLQALSAGANLFIFPQPVPRLDVAAVGNNDVPLGAGPTQIQLPFGANPSISVTVRASGWKKKVPITVMLTPDSGAPTKFDAEIDNTTIEPATAVVPVQFPVNTLVTVQVWTR